MATSEVLRREIKVLAFDQYGTIVDMQKGLTEAVTPFLERKGWPGNPNSFVTWWRRTHFDPPPPPPPPPPRPPPPPPPRPPPPPSPPPPPRPTPPPAPPPRPAP